MISSGSCVQLIGARARNSDHRGSVSALRRRIILDLQANYEVRAYVVEDDLSVIDLRCFDRFFRLLSKRAVSSTALA